VTLPDQVEAELPLRGELLVGTYTEKLPFVTGTAPGILSCSYEDGVVGPPALLAKARNPSWLTITGSGRNVYAIHEVGDFEGQRAGGVTGYARDPGTGELVSLGSHSSGGLSPAHVAVCGPEQYVLVANYDSGSVAVFGTGADGALTRMVGLCQHVGSSADPERQAGPHAHMVCPDPVTGEVLVADLGMDMVLSYDLGTDGVLAERVEQRIICPPGAGPRHVAFHPDGRHLFVLNEINSTLITLRREGTRFVQSGITSTLPGDCTQHSEAAEVRVSASGRYVFASNRGFDSISMLALDPGQGTLELVHVEPTRGRGPRAFCQTPDCRYLLAANQDSHSIVTLAIDEDAPALRAVSSTTVPSPVCLVFAPVPAAQR
jgi:6-phosphogluconolactonase